MPSEMFWSLLRHRHAVIGGALAAVIVASWAYLWLGAGIEMEMRDIGGGHGWQLCDGSIAPKLPFGRPVATG